MKNPMSFFKINSIRSHFIFTLVSAVVLIFLIFSTSIIYQNVNTIENQLAKRLDDACRLAEKSLPSALWQYNYDYVGDFIESLFLFEDIVFVKVVSGDLVIKEKSHSGFLDKSFLFFQKSPSFSTKETSIDYNGEIIGKIQIVITCERINQTILHNSILSIMFVILFISAIISIIYFNSKRYIFKPLSRLENSASEIAGGNWDAEIDTSGSDEIGNLSKTFHQMIQNLKTTTASRDELEREIRERQQAQEAEKQEQSLSRTIIDSIPGTFYMLDEEGRYVRWNAYQKDEIVGKSEIEIAKTNALETIHPDDRIFIGSKIANVLKNGGEEIVEGRVLLRGGPSFRWFLMTGRQIIIKGGPFLLGTGIDITERKHAEEALQESEKRLRNAQRIGKLGSLDWNLATNELVLSEETLAIYGFEKRKSIVTLEEIITFVHPEDKQCVRQSLNAAIANKVRHELEHRIIRPDGEVIYIRAMAELFHDTDGKSVRLIGTIMDITERKQAEAEKAELEVQNQQLQKAESLGRMAGAIAHHFNNQLYAVMGNLEMALDDLSRGEYPVENLDEALKATRKAAEVSRLMLTYLGQTPGKHVPIDLSENCRQCLTLLQVAAPKGMTIKTDFPSSGPVILADAGQIQQVLSSLINNAWEATGENKGTVDLTLKMYSHADIPTLKRFPINWRPLEIVYACLQVSDTGHGIMNKDIERIFDPFFTTRFTGRGLGLPVVMGIVKAHGGGVTVDSEPGQGSVFRVFLPVSTDEVTFQPDLPAMLEALQTVKAEKFTRIEGGGTVLVIEDEAQVRNMVKKMLTRLGYKVIEATDGADAVEIFQQHQHEIHIVLSDLTMPRMDGWETLAALRKLSPEILVILSSGYDEAQVMADEHTEQPNAFLGKPYQLKVLRDTINRVMSDMS
jgi:PAS domain S-box-containing protein